MKRAKQLFSILLVALMVFSLVPQAFSAGAAEEDAGTQLDQSQEQTNTDSWQTNTDTWQAAGGSHYHQYTGYSVLREPTCSSYGEAYIVLRDLRRAENRGDRKAAPHLGRVGNPS